MITPAVKEKIGRVLSVFETTSNIPRYDILVVMADGPKVNGRKIRQITYGKHQTTEYGNLKTLVQMYIDAKGKFAKELKNYLPVIGVKPLADNYTFMHYLKLAGGDSTMHETQDRFFDQLYWQPAFAFFLKEKFTLPLSMLVIYDSYIQSGGMLDFLRKRFPERTPANGGSEKKWIAQYTEVRDNWLEKHSDPLLRSSDYRTDCLLDAIAAGNWDLSQQLVCKFNSSKPKKWITIS